MLFGHFCLCRWQSTIVVDKKSTFLLRPHETPPTFDQYIIREHLVRNKSLCYLLCHPAVHMDSPPAKKFAGGSRSPIENHSNAEEATRKEKIPPVATKKSGSVFKKYEVSFFQYLFPFENIFSELSWRESKDDSFADCWGIEAYSALPLRRLCPHRAHVSPV